MSQRVQSIRFSTDGDASWYWRPWVLHPAWATKGVPYMAHLNRSFGKGYTTTRKRKTSKRTENPCPSAVVGFRPAWNSGSGSFVFDSLQKVYTTNKKTGNVVFN